MSFNQSFYYSGPASGLLGGGASTDTTNNQEQNMGYPVEDSYLLYFLESLIGLVIIVFLLYILGHPDSPLQDYIDPKTVPEIPVLPSHYSSRSGSGLTTIEILLVWFAVIVVLFVFIWRNHTRIAEWLNERAPNWARSHIKAASTNIEALQAKVNTINANNDKEVAGEVDKVDGATHL